jgi:hemolysin activation/secretion protein
VSVPPEALVDGTKLRDEILLINIIEAPLSSITTNYFNPDNERVEKGYLKSSALTKWSPAQTGEVGNQKKLDDFVNLLNLNPDRYISAVVSQGEEEQTLALGYNIYEANPWHYFLQADNAGTDDRQWAPRVGILNTNLTGIDDKFTVFYQAPWESGIEDRYSVYGNYDLPIMGPRLRLELYSGYSQFDVDGGGGIDFLGHGFLYGGKLRYNAFQDQGWFFDLTTSLGHEKSRVTSSIFNSILGSEVSMDLWGIGFDIHRRDDMSSTSITLDRIQSVGGSSQRKFWDTATLTGARTNADRDFTIYTTSANHSQYLDADKIERLSGSLRWLVPNERLVPAKMTTFGGMFSVRGYKESRIVADGGVLASVQYEYDLVRHDLARDTSETGSEKLPWLRKLAPLAFFDFGRAMVKNRVAGEQGSQDLYSVGVGTLVEIGDNFSGALYYGYPLESTNTTDEGEGRINISLMMRW